MCVQFTVNSTGIHLCYALHIVQQSQGRSVPCLLSDCQVKAQASYTSHIALYRSDGGSTTDWLPEKGQ